MGKAGYHVLTVSNRPQDVAPLRSGEPSELLITELELPGGLTGR